MNTDSNPTKLLTVDELAAMLKISKRGVYRLIEQRRIRFYKVRRNLRFYKTDIIAFLQENRVDVVKNIGT